MSDVCPVVVYVPADETRLTGDCFRCGKPYADHRRGQSTLLAYALAVDAEAVGQPFTTGFEQLRA